MNDAGDQAPSWKIGLDVIQSRFALGDPAFDALRPYFEPCVIVGTPWAIDHKKYVKRMQDREDPPIEPRPAADVEWLGIFVCHLTALV